MATGMSTACKLCYSNYTIKCPERTPRKLQCEHIFCTECVEKLKQLQGCAIECPSCMTITAIPTRGVGYLPKDYNVLGMIEGSKIYEHCKHCKKITYPPKYATLHCINCQDVYCGLCSDTVHLKVENQDHVIRLANSFDDMTLSKNMERAESARRSKGVSSIVPPDQRLPFRRQISSYSVCEEHGLQLSLFCQESQVRCCSRCKSTESHRSHNCNLISSDKDQERDQLLAMQQELDEHIETYSKVRFDVQKIMETLKKNTATSNENIRRYFRELRVAVDNAEKDLCTEVKRICEIKLRRLRDQCSKMIEIANAGKEISRNCEKVAELEYLEMCAYKKKLKDEINEATNVMMATSPAENSDMFVQFPSHESILASIKSCAYIVRVPPPPCNYKCSLTVSGDVSLSWDMPKNLRYTYVPNLFGVYASVVSKYKYEERSCNENIIWALKDFLKASYLRPGSRRRVNAHPRKKQPTTEEYIINNSLYLLDDEIQPCKLLF